MRTIIGRDYSNEHGEDIRTYEGTNSVVSRETLFEGNAHVEGDLLIEGTFHGEAVCSDTLTVGQNGNVEANLRARDLVIAGIVTGEMEVENRITLRSTAQLRGRLKAKALVVEEGAGLRVDCDIGTNASSFSLPERDL